MITVVTVSMLWTSFAINFAKSTFEIPQSVVQVFKPMESWLVNHDSDRAQLTEPGEVDETQTAKRPVKSNTIFIMIVDKLLFTLFLLLTVIMHN